MELQIIYLLIGATITIIYGVIGWFLKTMISELKTQLHEVRVMSSENKSKIDLVDNNHIHLNKRFDATIIEINQNMRDLINELKQLSKEIAKKKDI